jgi:serine/threonine-protein phosphatase CPPED1
MTLRNLFLLSLCAGSLCAQSFIQMSDPQFGMFAKDANFVHETANFEFAIATANRLKPAFVVVTGDLTNKSSDPAQVAEYKRILGKLDPAIKLYSVPGNHDVGNEPTKQSLATYRERYGPDYYSFRNGEIYGIVLNSNLEKGAEKVPDEAAKMEAWFRAELEKAKQSGAKHAIVFQHISFFLKEADEKDQYFNVPLPARERYLKLMHEYGVKQVFAGHLHQNSEGRDGALDMVTTAPVGMPLGGARSGVRIVNVTPEGITHKFYDFGELPQDLLKGER